MLSLEEIRRQIQRLPVSLSQDSTEMNCLPQNLDGDEIIDSIAQCSYNNTMGLAVATNKKVIFISDCRLLFNIKNSDLDIVVMESTDNFITISMCFGAYKISANNNVLFHFYEAIFENSNK